MNSVLTKTENSKSIRAPFSAALLLLTTMVMSPPVFADKPEWAGGGGKSGHREQQSQRGAGRDEGGSSHEHRENQNRDDHGRDQGGSHHQGERNHYFNDQHREAVRAYYEESYRSGRCPPGLAKKHNGCLPPSQARKWRMGSRLPQGVIYYDLPPSVGIRLGVPPSGHKYVRVAGDILLIAIGTGMVIDAIEDITR